MCRVLNVGKSAFYSWDEQKEGKWKAKNRVIIDQIKLSHKESHSIYGSPRITKALRANNFIVSRPRVARLMKSENIRSRIRKRFVVTTDSKHTYPVADNVLERDFKAREIAQKWVSDITYIRTGEGWLYLTMILDLADRRVVGWSLSPTMKAEETTLPAWEMALKNRRPQTGLIFHSDRGIQYACTQFTALLGKSPEVIRSMSRKGNCWDNAVAESFFKSLKTEWVYGKDYKTKEQAAVDMFQYIEVWYNRKRLHSSIDYSPPSLFGNKIETQLLVA
jgi:putative transposase